jgi:hypothetical protein
MWGRNSDDDGRDSSCQDVVVSSRIVIGVCVFLASACDRQPGSSPSSASPPAPTVETAKLETTTRPAPPAPAGLLDFPWLEPGRRSAEVMTIGGTPEMEAIAARFKEAARKNQAWFEKYTAEHAGETLPWHANMGITPEEYQAFLQSKGTLGMHKQIDTVLVVAEDGPDIALSSGGKWKFFDDLKVRIKKDASQGNTVVGPLSRKVQVVASEAQSVTGPWDGSCWRASELTGLCLGKTRSGRGILTYEARTANDPRPQANSDFVVLFELARLP